MSHCPTSFDYTIPVLVVGGGACGTVAALAASDAGAPVLVVEQDASPLGTTAQSQGLICAAGTRAQKTLGIDDDPARFLADILAKVKGQTDADLARLIAEEAGPCIDWLVQSHDLPYELDVRFKAAYGHTRPRVHGWIGHGGIDLIGLLHARLAARNIDVMTRARLVEICASADGRARGVVLERPDGSREAVGCGALILAAGGFGGNREMVRRYLPDAAAARFNGHEGNRGDAIALGAAMGAKLADMGAYQGYGMLTEPQAISVPPGVLVEGGILVNARAERFVDETLDISGMLHPVLAQPGSVAWVVYDAAIEDRCLYIPETRQLVALRAPRQAQSIGDLAQLLQMDPAALAATLDEAHLAHRAGTPDPIGRRWAAERPPSAPYRALKVTGALYHTQGGLQIGRDARVQRPDGTALPNVYAGGGSARCVSGPASWGYLPAMGLCSAVTFGRVAGRSAAGAVRGTA
jgi:fumarate reductase flavoprotein subunit